MSEALQMGYAMPLDYNLTQTLPGTMEEARAKLAEALPDLNYTVITDQPLQAQRGAQGLGAYYFSFDPLDYPLQLTIGLRQLNAATVQAVFNYRVLPASGVFTRGDEYNLELEARAIVARALNRRRESLCPACQTSTGDDSRCCRRCGAALSVVSTEIELLQLSKGAREGYRGILMGAVLLLLGALVAGFLWWLIKDPAKAFKAAAILGGILGLIGSVAFLSGLWELRRTLNAPIKKSAGKQSRALQTPATENSVTNAPEFTPVVAPLSITEGTTELLATASPTPAGEHIGIVRQDKANTAEM